MEQMYYKMPLQTYRIYYLDHIKILNQKLATPQQINRGEHTIFTREALQQIAEQFGKLQEEEGYNFEPNLFNVEEMQSHSSAFIIKRIVKLRFRCKNNRCTQFKRSSNINDDEYFEKERHWTSYYGVVQFKYFFEENQAIINTRESIIPKLFYSFIIYKQKCRSCGQWGKSGLIESVFDNLISLYVWIIEYSIKKIMNSQLITFQDKERYGTRPKMWERGQNPIGKHISTRNHERDLCEACQKGVCIGFYRPNTNNSNRSNNRRGRYR